MQEDVSLGVVERKPLRVVQVRLPQSHLRWLGLRRWRSVCRFLRFIHAIRKRERFSQQRIFFTGRAHSLGASSNGLNAGFPAAFSLGPRSLSLCRATAIVSAALLARSNTR